MDAKDVKKLIAEREFISVATCDLKFLPNAAPKFLLKVEGNFIYLVDYTIGKTLENLRVNPRASLSFMDSNSLVGYQINGPTEVIEDGSEYKGILKEMERKQIDLSIKRVIEAVERGKTHKSFEVIIPEKVVIIKLKVEEIAEIGPAGTLKKEKL